MRKNLLMTLAIAVALCFAGCTKTKDSLPEQDESTSTPVGTAVGESVSKNIGASGGEITSADGTIRLIIPSGALTAETPISIQPISNNLTEGIGNAYRLAPHGQQFAKPVTIVFNYKAEDTANTIPEMLDIAFQDSTGSWQMLTNTTVNKTQRKISATTTHFSDWGYFKSMKLMPSVATVELEAFQEFEVKTTFPYVDPDDAAPGTYTIKLLKKPRNLRPDEIKSWDYAGEGSLEPEGAWAFYTAPDHEPSVNPEAVVANVQMHRKGQFMLVANVTVLAGHGVDYLQVDEDHLSPLNDGKCMLYLYGSFGNDPGQGKRTVKVNGTVCEVNLWAPTLVRCAIDEYISGAVEIISNNQTVARTVLRKYSGDFVYERYHGGVANAGSSDPLKERSEFKFVFRGFGSPCPANVNRIPGVESALAAGTESKYTLGGSASVSTPPSNGCVETTSVTLPKTSGWYFVEPASLGHLADFTGEVEEVAGGIIVRVAYEVRDVIGGVRVRRANSCGSSSLDPVRSLGVGFEGFNNEPIALEFWEVDGLKLKGTNQLKTPRMATGILIEAWDGTGNPSHYETDGLVAATFADN